MESVNAFGPEPSYSIVEWQCRFVRNLENYTWNLGLQLVVEGKVENFNIGIAEELIHQDPVWAIHVAAHRLIDAGRTKYHNLFPWEPIEQSLMELALNGKQGYSQVFKAPVPIKPSWHASNPAIDFDHHLHVDASEYIIKGMNELTKKAVAPPKLTPQEMYDAINKYMDLAKPPKPDTSYKDKAKSEFEGVENLDPSLWEGEDGLI